MNLLDNYKKNSFEDIFFPNVPFETAKNNFVKGYLLSLKMLIVSPFAFFKTMHVNKGYFKPFIFALINVILSVVVSNTYMYYDLIDTPQEQMEKLVGHSSQMPIEVRDFFNEMQNKIPAFSFDFQTVLVQNIGLLLNIILIIMIWQTALLVFRLADNGLQATWRVVCYSTVVLLVNLLPINQMITNSLLFGWGFLLIIIGLSEAHELTWQRTLLAAISLPLVAILFTLPFMLK